jgi:hypothetical protein
MKWRDCSDVNKRVARVTGLYQNLIWRFAERLKSKRFEDWVMNKYTPVSEPSETVVFFKRQSDAEGVEFAPSPNY